MNRKEKRHQLSVLESDQQTTHYYLTISCGLNAKIIALFCLECRIRSSSSSITVLRPMIDI